MKRIIILLFLFSCCTELDPVDKLILKNVYFEQSDISLNINGLGITESSFARSADEWNHILSGIDAEVKITKFDDLGGSQRFDSFHPYNTLNAYRTTLEYGKYLVSIPQPFSSSQGLTFRAISDTINVDASTTSIDMKANTAQCLILIVALLTCTDSIPTIGGFDFYLHEGFWYRYPLAIADSLKYVVDFCTASGPKQVDIVGARRETIYYINIGGGGDVNLNIGLDSLFTSTIIIN